MVIWTKENISELTDKEIKQWFDVYNHGLIEDRGYQVNELNDTELDTISKSIEEDYKNYLLGLDKDSNFLFYSILYIEDKIVSICRVVLINGKHYIEGLETHRSYRKKGYGKRILDFTISELSKRDINKLYSSIRKHNTASIETHKSVGFKITNETEDDYILVLDIHRYSKIKLFNEWASNYNESVKKSDEADVYPFSGYSLIKREIFDLVIEREDIRILEMGIGTGEITYPIYKLGYNITGVDLSYRMIQKSKEIMPNATFIHNDFISSLNDISDEKFDIILFNYSIHHLNYNNQLCLLESLHNNLNLNGVIIIGDVMTKTTKEMKELSEQYKSSWDDEEYYPTKEKYNNLVLNKKYSVKYKEITHCSGILRLDKRI